MEIIEVKNQLWLLKKVYNSMKEGIEKENLTLLERDGVVQRFEFTIEITGKTLKKILKYEGVNDNIFPREIIKEFGKKGIIENTKLFLDFLDLRNNTSHNYDEDMVEEMFNFIKNNYKSFEELIKKIELLLDKA